MYNNYYILIIILIYNNMMVIGLLSTQNEVEEIKYIAKVCSLEDRIRFIVRMQKIKDMLRKEKDMK